MNVRTALEIVCQWRKHFTTWQLGTRDSDDPEAAAVADHREQVILLTVQVRALADLLASKGVIDDREYDRALVDKALELNAEYTARWEGAHVVGEGMEYDLDRVMDAGWMKGWNP